MEAADLRLLLGISDGVGCSSLATSTGLSTTTVRRRLHRLAGPDGPGWLRASGTGYELTERGSVALGPVREALAMLAAIARTVAGAEVSLRDVELIALVTETGSLGGAARCLGLPRSSVSARVARVEQRWHTPLFVRAAAGVLPTAALGEALPQIRRLAQVLAHLRAVPAPETAILELASEFGFSGLLDMLATEGLTNVRLHVVDIPGRSWTPAMLDADICVYADLPLASLAVPAGYETIVAFRDPAHAFVPAVFAGGCGTISLTELADQDWLTGPVGTRNHQSVVTLCRSAGFEPRIRYTAPNGAVGRQILEAGTAVALTGATGGSGRRYRSVRLAEEIEVRMTVGWPTGSTVRGVAHRVARWLAESRLDRLATLRPELLAEPGSDPVQRTEAPPAHPGWPAPTRPPGWR